MATTPTRDGDALSDTAVHLDTATAAAPFRWWMPVVVAISYVGGERLSRLFTSPATIMSGPLSTLGLSLLAGLIAGLVLGPLACRLQVTRAGKAVVLFACAWVFSAASNTVEALLYLSPSTAARVPLLALLPAVALAVSLTLTSGRSDGQPGLRLVLADYLRRRRPATWVWRGVLLAVAWVPLVQPVAGFDLAPRIANLLEISGDALVFGLLGAVLLAVRQGQPPVGAAQSSR